MVVSYVGELADALSACREDVVGVYLHGSAVLGGFDPARSDVDVLAVVARPSPDAASQLAMGEALAAVGGCPGTGLELSVITAATAARLGDCPFEVHVATRKSEPPVIVAGFGHAGDPDLVLHSAVCREHALAVAGPPPAEVFGPVERERILAAMVSELEWGMANAPSAYFVLNACRAMRFAFDGTLCSKVDGGRWFLDRHPGNATVAEALAGATDR
ncbi:MAG TPA: aminoglycoside adenylyltransferase domain-containing protein [Candidatus Limnocylindrales bacterium]